MGIVLCASGRVYRILSFRRLLRSSEAPSSAVLGMAEGIAKRLGLRRVPEIRMMPVCVSPLVWSLGGRPRVFLPAALFERLDGAAREAILAHELAHVRRKDHWVRLLEMLVTTLFWWHPVVWWAARQLQELEDQCCDAMVLGIDAAGGQELRHRVVGYARFPFRTVHCRSAGSDGRQIFHFFGKENCHVEEFHSRDAFNRRPRNPPGRRCRRSNGFGLWCQAARGHGQGATNDARVGFGHHTGPAKAVVQSSLAAQPAQSLKQALAAFNEKSAQDAIGRSQPPLTEREVITAIREWNRKKIEVGDQTYAIFEKIADTKTLPQGSALEFTTRHVHDGRDVTVWWIDLSVMTGKTTGYTFRIRAWAIDYRPDESVERRRINKLVKDFPEKTDLSTPESALAAYERACANKDAKALWKLGWLTAGPREIEETQRFLDHDGKDTEAYRNILLNTEVIEVLTYRDDLAEVISKSRIKVPAGAGPVAAANPYSSRSFGRIDGVWTNLGEDRLPSLEAARKQFDERKDDLWRYFVKVRDGMKHGEAGTSAANRRNADSPRWHRANRWESASKRPI